MTKNVLFSSVVVKEQNNDTDPMYLMFEPNDPKVNTVPNDISPIKNINFIPFKFEERLQSSVILPQTSKKRIRKRTHKKKQEVKQIEVVENVIYYSYLQCILFLNKLFIFFRITQIFNLILQLFVPKKLVNCTNVLN